MVTLADLDRCDPREWHYYYRAWFQQRQLPLIFNVQVMMAYIERLEAAVNQGGRHV